MNRLEFLRLKILQIRSTKYTKLFCFIFRAMIFILIYVRLRKYCKIFGIQWIATSACNINDADVSSGTKLVVRIRHSISVHFSREFGATMSRSRRANLPRRWRASDALTRPGTIRQQMREPDSLRALNERATWWSLNTPTKFCDSANFFTSVRAPRRLYFFTLRSLLERWWLLCDGYY